MANQLSKLSPVAEKPPRIVKCQLCKDYGFTGAADSILPTGDWLPEAAFRQGVKCSCPEGRWFAAMQAKNREVSDVRTV